MKIIKKKFVNVPKCHIFVGQNGSNYERTIIKNRFGNPP